MKYIWQTQHPLYKIKPKKTMTVKFASVFEQIFVGDGQVAALQASPLSVWPFSGIQLPWGGVRRRIVPHRPNTYMKTLLVFQFLSCVSGLHWCMWASSDLSWVSCWTSSCQCRLALRSVLYRPLMCCMTFFLSMPCLRDTLWVMSAAIFEMSFDFPSNLCSRLTSTTQSLEVYTHTCIFYYFV